MSIIPFPQVGQPLDISYIYQIVTAVNDLATKVSSSTGNYATINNETAKTSNLKVIAQSKEVTTGNASVNAGSEQTFNISFSSAFKYVPVVTATPVNIGGTPSGKEVSVVLTSITTSGVSGIVKFNASGVLSVNVNIIAVGIPN